jgi:hypothetical protein
MCSIVQLHSSSGPTVYSKAIEPAKLIKDDMHNYMPVFFVSNRLTSTSCLHENTVLSVIVQKCYDSFCH